MPPVPATLQAFFTLYPNALDVYFLADGTAYLNHFLEKAVRAAKVSNQILYKVTNAQVVSQEYPELELLTFTGSAATASIEDCTCNGFTVAVETPISTEFVENAMNQVCANAGVAIESVQVTEPIIGQFSMTLTTYNTATFLMGAVELTQS